VEIGLVERQQRSKISVMSHFIDKAFIPALAACIFGTTLQAESLVVGAPPFLRAQDGDTIVFLGDSITHQSLYTQYVEDFFYTRYPDRKIHFHNAGVSGDKAADALARFDDDVAAFEPDFVTILLGMNDGRYEPYNDETFGIYRDDMTEILELVAKTGAETIALSPTMFDHHQLALRQNDPDFRFNNREFFPQYNSLMGYYSGWLRGAVGEQQSPFVNFWGPLNDITSAARLQQPDFTLVEDAIHPGAAGQFIMAFTILAAAQPERRGVSSVAISQRGGKWIAPKKAGVTDLVVSEAADSVAFTHLAKALPWVVPAESSEYDLKWGKSSPAALGYELTKAGHKLSGERLRIQGLAPGEYELTIDDENITRFTHSALAAGVELQKYPQTPQSRQALEVALLNRERNDKAVRPTRDLWSKVKGLRNRLDAEKFAAEYPELKTQIHALNKSADDYETRIYDAAQPRPRRYQLNRFLTK